MNKLQNFSNVQLIAPLQDVSDLFRSIVREELQSVKERELEEKLLSPEETCKLFQPAITKPTLESYAQKGHFKKYHLGGRTWFKYAEVMDSMKVIRKFQR
jgi:hypothetical protein